jgi:beta-xylosidase
MTAFLPARAPTRHGLARSTSIRRRVAGLGIVTALVAAAPAWPHRPELGHTTIAPADTPRAGVSAPVGDMTGSDARADRPPHANPRKSDPQPPADRRDTPDPFILDDGGRYVLYSTQVGFHNVPVATSPDLQHWSSPSDALPRLPSWAEWGHTWAPAVTRLGGRYLLYFTARHRHSGRQCIGVAVGATAVGPFVSPATWPLVCQTDPGGSIDPQPFVDSDGRAFLLWKSEGNAIGQPSAVFAQRLSPDGLTLAGQPSALLTSGAAWEQHLIENPALIATGRSYMLLYSGGWWESASYAIGYATCDTPLGPCSRATIDRPLLASAGNEAGPGGACVVRGPSGDPWLAYHAWTPGAIGYDNGGTRSLRFASLGRSGDRPVVGR